MISASVSVPADRDAISAAVSLAGFAFNGLATAQLAGAAVGDAADFYGANLAGLTSTAEMTKLPNLTAAGPGPGDQAPVPFLYVYAVRTAVTTGTALVAVIVGGEASGGSGAGGVPLVTGIPGAINVTDYYISPIGNDANDGRTPFTPLATPNGLLALIGAQYVPNNATLTVHCANGSPPVFSNAVGASAVYSPGPSGTYNFASIFTGIEGRGMFVWEGVRSYLGGPRTTTPAGYTATVLSSTIWVGTTQTEASVTTDGGASFVTYNSSTGYAYEVVGGARDGLLYFFYYDSRVPGLSATVAKTGGCGVADNNLKSLYTYAGGVYTMPQPGDVLRVVALPKFPGAYDADPALATPVVCGDGIYTNLELGQNTGAPFYGSFHTVCVRSTMTSVAGPAFNNCIVRGADYGPGNPAIVGLIGCAHFAGHLYGVLQTHNTTIMGIAGRAGGSLFTSTTYVPVYAIELGISFGRADWTIFDCTSTDGYTQPTYVDSGGVAYAQFYCWWKNGASGIAALEVRPGSSFLYEPSYPPAVVGTQVAQPFVVGSTPYATSALPINTTNGARITSDI